MPQLIDHIVRTSARRDRTQISEALVEAMVDLFHPEALTLYRCLQGDRRTMLFACAGLNLGRSYVRNAYLPQTEYCRPIDFDPLLRQCQKERSMVFDVLPDDRHRLVFPIAPVDHLLYLIDITVSMHLPANQRTILMGLIEYFSNHVALLDYGETDTLTELPNRKTFDKHLFEVLGQAAHDAPSARNATAPLRRKAARGARHWLAVCDIDHFKSINDRHGHLIGDEILVSFARLMRDAFRYQDQLFRFGGEEFIAVLQPASDEAAAQAFERFRARVAQHPFSPVGRVTASVGYSALHPNDTPTDVIDRADEALYYVKQHGRNGIACYEQLIAEGKLTPRELRSGEVELF